jgi:hypothetical protein
VFSHWELLSLKNYNAMFFLQSQLETVSYWFVVITFSLLGFLLIRFYFLVDEIRKDVKVMMVQDAVRSQLIENIKEDVMEFKVRMQEYEKKLNYLQREIERNNKKS